jgi:hypothetical protein
MRVSCFDVISGLVDGAERRLRKKALKELKNEKLYKTKKPRLMKKEYSTYRVR